MELTFKDKKRTTNPEKIFHQYTTDLGFNFATGVPCGVLKDFIINFKNDFIHIGAQNEPEAIGIAAGAYLGGKKPIIYMQNSGLLKSINDIGSLLIPYKIPILGIVTYRGCEGEDAPQHIVTGKITKPTLELLGINTVELEENNIEKCVLESTQFMEETGKPSVILVKRSWKTNNENSHQEDKNNYNIKQKMNSDIVDLRNYELDYRDNILEKIIESTNNNDAIFFTTGLISRSIYERFDSPNYFYNTGSFGQVSSEGLGFAVSKPNTRTIVVDGDSSILTNMGTLATIGHYKPKNLIHIVLDNEAYGSCSEEKSLSKDINITKTAQIFGYTNVFVADDSKTLSNILNSEISGTTMIHTKIKLGGRRDFKRPLDLNYVQERFKNYFKKK